VLIRRVLVRALGYLGAVLVASVVPCRTVLFSAAPFSAAPLAAVPQDQQAQADSALTTLVERYFAALNQHDADAALRLWSASAEEQRFTQDTLVRMLRTSNPTWTNIQVSRVTVDGARARANVRFDLTYYPTSANGTAPASNQISPTPISPHQMSDVMTFVREADEWRIASEVPESRDIADRLLAAPDEAALNRLLAAEGAAVNWSVMQELLGIGGSANVRGNFAEGIRASSLALRLSEARAEATAGTPQGAVGELYILHALTDLAWAQAYKPNPDLPRALELLTRALEIQTRNKDEGGQADTLQAMANAYYAAADYSRALDHYQRALALHTRIENGDAAARSRLGIGNVQYLFGQYDLALEAYQLSLQTFERLQLTEPQPRALLGLGRVYEALGDYVRSHEQFTRALALLSATSRRSEQASTLLDLGHICFLQGKLVDAATHINEALAINTQLNDAAGQGRALFATGLLQVVHARYDEAVQTYTRSAEAFTRASHREGLGQAILARAAAKFERGDLPGALDDYAESARTFEAAKNRDGVARAQVGLAMTHVVRREPKPALEAAEIAWRMAEEAVAPDIGWQARYEAGRAHALAGDSDHARQDFEEAIATLERSRFEAGGDADMPPPARRAAPYIALAEWYVSHDDPTHALLMAEAAKRRLLQDLLLPYRFRLARGLTPDQQRDERRIVSQRVSLSKQLRRERERPAPDTAHVAALTKQLDAARASALDWDRTLARDNTGLVFDRGDAELSSLDPLADRLTDDSALVHFIVGDERTTAIVVTRKPTPTEAAIAGDATIATAFALPRAPLDVRAYTVAATRAQLADQVARFVNSVNRSPDTDASGAADARVLYDRLLGPARDQLAGRTQLIIVPDDVLWTLPFEALKPSVDRYLVQEAAITLLPSCAAWLLRPPAQLQPDNTASPGIAEALIAAGTISDVSPLQSTLTLSPSQNVAATPASFAAWELFEHALNANTLLLADRSPADEQLRLDQGRLGVVALVWALQVSGVPRVIIARWPLSKEAQERGVREFLAPADRPAAMRETMTVHESAAWMRIGPPH